MLLQLDDVYPPLPPPDTVPALTEMEVHYEHLMRELNMRNDEVTAFSHQKYDQDRTIQYTVAELRNTEQRFFYRSTAKRCGHAYGLRRQCWAG